MKTNQKKVELLLPVQNKKSLLTVKDTADAVYFGLETLNMRMHANNISQTELPEIVQLCHEMGIKAYLTTNVIIYQNELTLLDKLLETAKDAGVDAVIVHDLAAISTAKRVGIPFHISTQASISNALAAQMYHEMGAERIIFARELSLSMIQEVIKAYPKVEYEAFIHGAQCTSVSGRCYLSTAVCDSAFNSANRGRCTQPCRDKWTIIHHKGAELEYSEGYFLNSKDMCMIEHIPELIASGITTLKVEGRMRDAFYIDMVGRTYREAIDAYYDGTYSPERAKQWYLDLQKVYNRGFSTGFYFQRPNKEDISDTKGNQATTSKLQIGKVTAYYREIQVAKIELYQAQIKLGDTIYFEGTQQGNFSSHKVIEMQAKRKNISETPILQDGQKFVIGIKLKEPVKKGDFVYLLVPK